MFMETRRIHAVYFSPAGATRRLVKHLANALGGGQAQVEVWDFTLPAGRVNPFRAEAGEVVVAGMPVYAGRLPNLMLPYLNTWSGAGAYAVPVVVYGNRSYGNALIEWRDLLQGRGFLPVGAAAFVGEHAFAPALATRRPDEADFAVADEFAREICRRMDAVEAGKPLPTLEVPGIGAPDYGGYYQPLCENNEPARFLKAKPVTAETCVACCHCAEVCPMGAIDRENPSLVPGICIKCNACVRECSVGAKQLADPAFLSHVRYLEKHYTAPAPVEWF